MSKTKKSRNSKIKVISILVFGLVGTAVAGQILFNMHIYRMVASHGSHSIVETLNSSISQLSYPAAVDGPTGKVYIPEYRLVLPPYKEGDVSGLLYSYYSGEPEVRLTNSVILSQAKARLMNISTTGVLMGDNTDKVYENIFAALPEVQACSKVVHLSLKRLGDTSGLVKIGDKKLADGRDAIFYKETKCSLDTTGLVKYLKNVESY